MDWSKLTQQVSTIKVKNVVDMLLFLDYWCFVLRLLQVMSSSHIS